MRKLLIAALLASAAAAPAAAQRNQHGGHAGHQQTHQSSGGRLSPGHGPSSGHAPTIPHAQRGPATGLVQPGYGQHYGGPGQVQHVRPRTPLVGNAPHFGNEPPFRAGRRNSPQPHWNRTWRNDHRYDWHNWRQHHGSRYHVGYYHDPFGWGYSPFYVGWRLWPAYYAESYWIADPWEYRLPPAPPGTRWIRYYNDAILVDEWSGEVLDVIQGFFW